MLNKKACGVACRASNRTTRIFSCKQGQVSGFIIIGLVILISIFILTYYNDLEAKKRVIVHPSQLTLENTEIIKQFVQACVEETASATLIHLGQDGLLDPEHGPGSLAVFYSEGSILQPSIGEMEESVSQEIDRTVLECLEFAAETEKDTEVGRILNSFDITYGIPQTKTIFGEKKVTVRVKLPTTVKSGNSQIVYEDYSYSADILFWNIHDAVASILNSTAEDPGFIDASLLLELVEQGFNISLHIDHEEGLLIYNIVEPGSNINNEHYVYSFGVVDDEEFRKLVDEKWEG